MKRNVVILVLLIIATVIVTLYLLLGNLQISKVSKKINLPELIENSERAVYEGKYTISGCVELKIMSLPQSQVSTSIDFTKLNITLSINGTYTIGQETSNRTYMLGNLHIIIKGPNKTVINIDLPLQTAFLLSNEAILQCINMSAKIGIFSVRYARCNATSITKYRPLLEMSDIILTKMINESEYIGVNVVSGYESYCYNIKTMLNLTKYLNYILESKEVDNSTRDIIRDLLKFRINFTICYTPNGEVTYIHFNGENVEEKYVKMYMMLEEKLIELRRGYFNEEMFRRLLSLPR